MDGKNLFLKSYQTGPKNGSIHTTFNYRYQKLPNRIRKYSYHLTILQNFHLFFFLLPNYRNVSSKSSITIKPSFFFFFFFSLSKVKD